MIFRKNKRILLVDDNEGIRDTTVLILESWGLSVRAVDNGNDAIRYVAEDRPSLILLDVNLPGIRGLEVCRILKGNSDTKDIPVILFTGLGKTNEVEEGFQSGADDYMIKPVDWDRLKAKMSKLLDIKL